MLFSGDLIGEDEKVLSLALGEIEAQLRAQKDQQPNDLSSMKSLIGILDKYFSQISDQMYKRTVDLDVYRLIYEEVPDKEKVNDDCVEYRKRKLYPFPIAHLEKILTMKQNYVMQIFPYLLAAYYINFPNNHVILNPYAKSEYELESDSWEYTFFYEKILESEKSTIPTYKRTLTNFCNNFSLKSKISQFLRLKEVSNYFGKESELNSDMLETYLSKGGDSKIYYRCRFYVWIYAMCVRVCMQVAEIHESIDYVLSTRLFYQHTRAFKTLWNERISIKDFFTPDFLQAYREELGDKYLLRCSQIGFPSEALKTQLKTVTDIAQQALLILSVELHPFNDWQFKPLFFDDLIRTGKSSVQADMKKHFNQE